MMLHTRFALPVVVGVAALALTGCGGGGGGNVISQSRSEAYTMQLFMTTNIPAVNGESAKSVTCPSGVKVEKGKTFDCTVTLVDGRKAKVTYRITDNNGTVTYFPGSTTLLNP